MQIKLRNIILLVAAGVLAVHCVNPFAPALDKNVNSGGSFISDQKTVDGVFQNFLYAYTFRDTTIYGELLVPDFTFSFRDYDVGVDISWGRDDEMRVTQGLFKNSQDLDLRWNNIVSITEDSTNIVRSFDLTITFNPTDIILVDGRVNLTLVKGEDRKWRIKTWVDESNF